MLDAHDRLISVKAVAERVGISVSSVWNLVKKDSTFPRSRKIGPRATRWLLSQIDAWIEAQGTKGGHQ